MSIRWHWESLSVGQDKLQEAIEETRFVGEIPARLFLLLSLEYVHIISSPLPTKNIKSHHYRKTDLKRLAQRESQARNDVQGTIYTVPPKPTMSYLLNCTE